LANGDVDWHAVRELFPLTSEWTHLASFLIGSHPRPVAEAIERFRKKLDSDPAWIDQAAFADSEGHPYSAVKRALAEYVGGAPEEICLTSNTTGALAMAYHGLRYVRTRGCRSCAAGNQRTRAEINIGLINGHQNTRDDRRRKARSHVYVRTGATKTRNHETP